MNKSLQLQHFFLLIPAISNLPPDCQCYEKKMIFVVSRIKRKMKKEEDKKNF